MNSIAELVKQVQELTDLTQAQATEIAQLKAACDAQGVLTQKYQALALDAAQAAPQQHAQAAQPHNSPKSPINPPNSTITGELPPLPPYLGISEPENERARAYADTYGHQCRAAGVVEAINLLMRNAEIDGYTGASLIRALNKTEG